MKLKGVIFDFDGTLFDSMSIWETAGGDYLRSLAYEPEENLQERLKTMSLYQSACYCRDVYGIPLSVEEIMDGINKTVEDFYLYRAQPKPHIISFLQQLKEQGVSMCIATASETYQIKAALERCGMEQFFTGILTCTEVGHGKDEPHIFRKALKCLQTERSNTLVVEDALYALQTAKADGLATVAVYDFYETRQEELCALADCYLPDFSDFASFWEQISALSVRGE